MVVDNAQHHHFDGQKVARRRGYVITVQSVFSFVLIKTYTRIPLNWVSCLFLHALAKNIGMIYKSVLLLLTR